MLYGKGVWKGVEDYRLTQGSIPQRLNPGVMP